MSIRGEVLFLAHKNATCCISDPKQNGFSIKQKYAPLQKYIKIRDDDFKTMIVNCNVNSCQFEVNFCFWLIRMQHVALVTQNKMDSLLKKIRFAIKIYKNQGY